MISFAELCLLQQLKQLGACTKLKLHSMGLPNDLVTKFIKVGLLMPIQHPTQRQFRLVDGLFDYVK
jgi:hypothetical protein